MLQQKHRLTTLELTIGQFIKKITCVTSKFTTGTQLFHSIGSSTTLDLHCMDKISSFVFLQKKEVIENFNF